VIDPESSAAEAAALVSAADPVAAFLAVRLADGLSQERRLAESIATFRIEGATEPRPRFELFRRKRPTTASTTSYPASLDGLEGTVSEVDAAPESATALILFTSGTTSRPKGVELTYRNLYAQFETFVRHYGFDSESRILNHLPLHHTDGLNQGPAITLFAGATLFRPARFSLPTLPNVMDSVYRERVTHLITVPTVLALILRLGREYDEAFKTPDFRFVGSTAGYLDEKIWTEFEQRFGTMVVNSYGLTETVSEAIYCGPTPGTRRMGTIGKPVDCEARIVDEAGGDVEPGEVGELVLRGDNVMKGYFRNPEATGDVIKEGWFHSGDLATRDREGFFRIVGRKKNVIIRGGLNVYPEDVTHAILSMSGVLDAVTFGLPDILQGDSS
jgi:long-chain acyl-CoA synthetase